MRILLGEEMVGQPSLEEDNFDTGAEKEDVWPAGQLEAGSPMSPRFRTPPRW